MYCFQFIPETTHSKVIKLQAPERRLENKTMHISDRR